MHFLVWYIPFLLLVSFGYPLLLAWLLKEKE